MEKIFWQITILVLAFSLIGCKSPKFPKLRKERIVLSERLQKVRMTDLEGRAYTLQDLAGKPIFLNFWATWCGPCRLEMPDIELAYQKYGKDIHFLALSTEDLSSIETYRKEQQLHFNCARLDVDYLEVYIVKLPTTILIDKTGNIVAVEEGARLWMTPAYEEKLKDLIK